MANWAKKLENLKRNLALYFMRYNFCRIHQTLCVTPAIEAGIAENVSKMAEAVGLLPFLKSLR